MTSGIYRIVNMENEKFYVGSASDIESRISNHFGMLEKNCHHCIHLQRAYNRYGDVFDCEIIYICEPVKDVLLNAEQNYLDYYWNSGMLYNSQPTAGSWLGMKHSKESIEHMRNIKFGKNNPMHGKKISDEHKARISAVHKGKTVSLETRQNMSKAQIGIAKGRPSPNKGKPMSEEQKLKIGKTKIGNRNWLGKHHSEDTRKKLRNAITGKRHSEETKRKIAAASRGRTHMLGKKMSEETKQKMRESARLAWQKRKQNKLGE